MPVHLKDLARAHILAALDDIKNGYIPEAISELYVAANYLKDTNSEDCGQRVVIPAEDKVGLDWGMK